MVTNTTNVSKAQANPTSPPVQPSQPATISYADSQGKTVSNVITGSYIDKNTGKIVNYAIGGDINQINSPANQQTEQVPQTYTVQKGTVNVDASGKVTGITPGETVQRTNVFDQSGHLIGYSDVPVALSGSNPSVTTFASVSPSNSEVAGQVTNFINESGAFASQKNGVYLQNPEKFNQYLTNQFYELLGEQTSLNATGKTLNTSNTNEVSNFNSQVSTYNAKAEALTQLFKAFNSDILQRNAQISVINQEITGRNNFSNLVNPENVLKPVEPFANPVTASTTTNKELFGVGGVNPNLISGNVVSVPEFLQTFNPYNVGTEIGTAIRTTQGNFIQKTEAGVGAFLKSGLGQAYSFALAGETGGFVAIASNDVGAGAVTKGIAYGLAIESGSSQPLFNEGKIQEGLNPSGVLQRGIGIGFALGYEGLTYGKQAGRVTNVQEQPLELVKQEGSDVYKGLYQYQETIKNPYFETRVTTTVPVEIQGINERAYSFGQGNILVEQRTLGSNGIFKPISNTPVEVVGVASKPVETGVNAILSQTEGLDTLKTNLNLPTQNVLAISETRTGVTTKLIDISGALGNFEETVTPRNFLIQEVQGKPTYTSNFELNKVFSQSERGLANVDQTTLTNLGFDHNIIITSNEGTRVTVKSLGDLTNAERQAFKVTTTEFISNEFADVNKAFEPGLKPYAQEFNPSTSKTVKIIELPNSIEFIGQGTQEVNPGLKASGFSKYSVYNPNQVIETQNKILGVENKLFGIKSGQELPVNVIPPENNAEFQNALNNIPEYRGTQVSGLANTGYESLIKSTGNLAKESAITRTSEQFSLISTGTVLSESKNVISNNPSVLLSEERNTNSNKLLTLNKNFNSNNNNLSDLNLIKLATPLKTGSQAGNRFTNLNNQASLNQEANKEQNVLDNLNKLQTQLNASDLDRLENVNTFEENSRFANPPANSNVNIPFLKVPSLLIGGGGGGGAGRSTSTSKRNYRKRQKNLIPIDFNYTDLLSQDASYYLTGKSTRQSYRQRRKEFYSPGNTGGIILTKELKKYYNSRSKVKIPKLPKFNLKGRNSGMPNFKKFKFKQAKIRGFNFGNTKKWKSSRIL